MARRTFRGRRSMRCLSAALALAAALVTSSVSAQTGPPAALPQTFVGEWCTGYMSRLNGKAILTIREATATSFSGRYKWIGPPNPFDGDTSGQVAGDTLKFTTNQNEVRYQLSYKNGELVGEYENLHLGGKRWLTFKRGGC
jgi:hypothetical protein